MSVLVNFVILFILFLSPAMALDRRNVSAGEVVIEPMITDLNTPWSIGFLPDGGILLTERGGRLLHIAKDGSVQEIAGLPPIFVKRQGGLFDIVPARDFESSGIVYLTYAAKVSGGGATTLAQARLSKDRTQLLDFYLLYQQADASSSGIHFGGRVVEAPDGSLFLTVGDRGERDLAQDEDSANGKVIYISADRTETEIWSIGHRNPQGAAIDLSGDLLTSEHGPQGGDELNRPEKGLNYGWPVITFGEEYGGGRIGAGSSSPGMEQPLLHWTPSIAPSGLVVYSGKLWPQWRGSVFTGSLKFNFISRMVKEGRGYLEVERLFVDQYIRIRDIREAPDGTIWFLAENPGIAYRMKPINFDSNRQ